MFCHHQQTRTRSPGTHVSGAQSTEARKAEAIPRLKTPQLHWSHQSRSQEQRTREPGSEQDNRIAKTEMSLVASAAIFQSSVYSWELGHSSTLVARRRISFVQGREQIHKGILDNLPSLNRFQSRIRSIREEKKPPFL